HPAGRNRDCWVRPRNLSHDTSQFSQRSRTPGTDIVCFVARIVFNKPARDRSEILDVQVVKEYILPEHDRQTFQCAATGIGNETDRVILVRAKDSEQT